MEFYLKSQKSKKGQLSDSAEGSDFAQNSDSAEGSDFTQNSAVDDFIISNKINNIFITGAKGRGKTTVLKKVTAASELNPGGFVTFRINSLNSKPLLFRLEPAEKLQKGIELSKKVEPCSKAVSSSQNLEGGRIKAEAQNKNIYNLEDYLKEESVFAYRNSPAESFKISSSVFDNYGVELLSSKENIILMDELGRFELKSQKFKQKVFSLTGSEKKILGVIKDEKNSFLDMLRQKADTAVFRVDLENRDLVTDYIIKLFKKHYT